jgi:PAS domain S-box-containing protein
MSIPDTPFSAALFLLLAVVALSVYILHRRIAFLLWACSWALLLAVPFTGTAAGPAWIGTILALGASALFALGAAAWEADGARATLAPPLAAVAVLALGISLALYAIDRPDSPEAAIPVGALAAGAIVGGWLLFRRARWEAPIGAAVTGLGMVTWGWILALERMGGRPIFGPWPLSALDVAAAVIVIGTIVLFAEIARAGTWRASDLELLLEEDPNMIFVVREGTVVFANRALRARSGRTLAQWRDKDPLRFLRTGERPEAVEMLARLRRGEVVPGFEIDFLDARGQAVPVIVHAHPIEWRGGAAWRYELVDITERRESEREVREMMKQLQRMNAELENSNRLQAEFLSNTSHELKTPLTSIIANAEVLEYEMCGPVNAEQRRVLANISRNSQHLLKMITSLLAYASQREGGDILRPQEVAIGMLLETVVETVRPLLEEGGLAVDMEVDPELPACSVDPEKIYRVYLNLIENAIKFSPTGVIRVGAQVVDGEMEGSVSDQGIGISPDMLEAVFQPFRQADASPTRTYGGVGLGLAICRHLVELHGGRIWAESERGGGATIRFRLPCLVRA